LRKRFMGSIITAVAVFALKLRHARRLCMSYHARHFAGFLVFVLTIIVGAAATAQQSPPNTTRPRFLANNELAKPDNYREWLWLSSGLGMTYGPLAQPAGPADPRFDNVFVTPEAYRSFLQTGKWPDKTMLVLEVRSSQSKGSINQQGRFQGDLIGIEAEVKDESRFPEKWGFFAFNGSAKSAKSLPSSTTDCQSCHSQNGAVDNTFVQFYPTLLEVAKQKGTLKAAQPASK